MKQFIVVVDDAAHDGFVEEVELDRIWTGNNPDGWSWQDVCGAHGTVRDRCDTREEANKSLEEYLVCHAAEEGRYCYTHNRI